jgi:hypothetical protein
MKNILLLLSLFVSLQFMAQTNSVDAILLQKCLDLPELQEFYPLEPSGELAQIYILQHGVSFPIDIGVKKNERLIKFLTKEDVSRLGVDSYFIFRTFEVLDENKARVEFTYYKSVADNSNVAFELDFIREDNEWSVVNLQITKK